MTLPVTIVGGYLGAGKTTLINHLLRTAAGLRLAVLVNEFGALAIDEDLIEVAEESLISIAGGCICCSFGDDLIGALMQLKALDPRPDHILVEASGVAIPASIAASISLVSGFRPNGVVVLADAESVRTTAGDKYLGDTILRQLQDADLVVMTKTDLVGAADCEALAVWLGAAAKGAEIIPAQHGRIALEVLLGPRSQTGTWPHSAHSDADFESVVLTLESAVDPRQLARQLATGEFGIIRAKGFVRDRSGGMVSIQIVGERWTLAEVAPDRQTAMVCIGRSGGLHVSALRRLIASFEADASEL